MCIPIPGYSERPYLFPYDHKNPPLGAPKSANMTIDAKLVALCAVEEKIKYPHSLTNFTGDVTRYPEPQNNVCKANAYRKLYCQLSRLLPMSLSYFQFITSSAIWRLK